METRNKSTVELLGKQMWQLSEFSKTITEADQLIRISEVMQSLAETIDELSTLKAIVIDDVPEWHECNVAERKAPCDFGVVAKKKLIDINKPQSWLIEQVREDTGQFIDSAYLSRILSGKHRPQKLITSICKILDIEYSEDKSA